MSDEDIHALARRALEAQDPHQLVRLVNAVIRDQLAAALVAAEPKPARGPYRPEEERHEMPPPQGYRHTDAGWRPRGQGTRLAGVIALDNEPLYDRIEIEPGAVGEHVFFATGIGGRTRANEKLSPGWGKNRTWTNQVNAMRLPEPERFEVTGVSLVVREDAPEEFVSWLRHETYFEFRLGGAVTPMDRSPSWMVTANRHRTKTGAVLADELYVKPPVLAYAETFLIDMNQNFSACVISDRGWKPRGEPPELHPTVMCILHGIHGRGICAR